MGVVGGLRTYRGRNRTSFGSKIIEGPVIVHRIGYLMPRYKYPKEFRYGADGRHPRNPPPRVEEVTAAQTRGLNYLTTFPTASRKPNYEWR